MLLLRETIGLAVNGAKVESLKGFKFDRLNFFLLWLTTISPDTN